MTDFSVLMLARTMLFVVDRELAMPRRTGDYLEELENLRFQTRCDNELKLSYVDYMRSLLDGLEQGHIKDNRRCFAEAALESALALLAVYRVAHPDENLETMSLKVDTMAQRWRDEQQRPLFNWIGDPVGDPKV
jgi:hypothetical protein